MQLPLNIAPHVNRVIKYLVLADLALLAGWGFAAPIFSVFVLEHVRHATLTTVGVVTALALILRGIVQLPIANALDRSENETASFRLLLAGLLVTTFSSFLFPFVTELWQLYIVVAIHTLGYALYLPAWSGIFSHHLDRHHTSLDWTLDKSVGFIAIGVSGLLGGIIANQYGFNTVFVLAGTFSLLAAGVVLLGPRLLFPRGEREANLRVESHSARTEHGH